MCNLHAQSFDAWQKNDLKQKLRRPNASSEFKISLLSYSCWPFLYAHKKAIYLYTYSICAMLSDSSKSFVLDAKEVYSREFEKRQRAADACGRAPGVACYSHGGTHCFCACACMSVCLCLCAWCACACVRACASDCELVCVHARLIVSLCAWCACACVCVCVCVRVHACACVRVCVHARVLVCLCEFMRVCWGVCTRACVCASTSHTCVCHYYFLYVAASVYLLKKTLTMISSRPKWWNCTLARGRHSVRMASSWWKCALFVYVLFLTLYLQ